MVSLSATPLKPRCIFSLSLFLWHMCFLCNPLFLFFNLPCCLSPSGSWAGSFLASRHLIGWVSLLFNTLISHSALHCSGAIRAQPHCPLHQQMLDGYKKCLWEIVLLYNASLACNLSSFSYSFCPHLNLCGNHKPDKTQIIHIFLKLLKVFSWLCV